MLQLHQNEALAMDPALFTNFNDLVRFIFERTNDQLRRTK